MNKTVTAIGMDAKETRVRKSFLKASTVCSFGLSNALLVVSITMTMLPARVSTQLVNGNPYQPNLRATFSLGEQQPNDGVLTKSLGEITIDAESGEFSLELQNLQALQVFKEPPLNGEPPAEYLLDTNKYHNCFSPKHPLTYHIHTLWLDNSKMNGFGPTECGGDYTGGHYDPGLACGPKSGNMLCSTLSIPSSSAAMTFNGTLLTQEASSEEFKNRPYGCTPDAYKLDSFVCEAGDLSGKHGNLYVDDNYEVKAVAQEPRPLSYGAALDGRSIVVHCADGTRAFCAKIFSDSSVASGVDEEETVDLLSSFNGN